MKVTKAIFPVAGLGTRFLPATKANPKEMLPIVDKPLIQYAVEEAILAGITDLIFVTNSSKRAIEDHFDSNFELEANLVERGKHQLLTLVQSILPKGVSCVYIRQRSPLGLGHAVLCAKHLISDAPFAVLLADDLISNPTSPCLQQMVEIYAKVNASVIAVEKIAPAETVKYGVVDIVPERGDVLKIKNIVEKPQPANAPSNLGVVGRYILTPQIFSFLETIPIGSLGELQLTDAIAELLKVEPVYAYQFKGRRFDCGNKLGYLEATLNYALQHSEVGGEFKVLLKEFATHV